MKKQFLMVITVAVAVGAGCAPTSSFPDKNNVPGGQGGTEQTTNPATKDDSSKVDPAPGSDTPATPKTPPVSDVTCGDKKIKGIWVQMNSKAEIDSDPAKTNDRDLFTTVKGKSKTDVFVQTSPVTLDEAGSLLMAGAVHTVNVGAKTYTFSNTEMNVTSPVPLEESAEKDSFNIDPAKSEGLPFILSQLLGVKIEKVENCQTNKAAVSPDGKTLQVLVDVVGIPAAPEAPKTETPKEEPKQEEPKQQ